MTTPYHFPPDLFNLLVETVPRINKTKKDLLTFFKNVGTPLCFINEFKATVELNPQQISKKDITRRILEQLNSDTDKYLSIRRNLLQRIIDFDAFDTCYPDDIDIAKARISDIKKIVNLKDSITKQSQFLEQERILKKQKRLNLLKKIELTKSEFEKISNSFVALFSIKDPQLRGKELEKVLNNFFAFYKIGIKDAFCITDGETGKIYEQIDGVIEINNTLTLVEMKWEKSPIGVDKASRFMARLFMRNNVDGIIISSSSFADTAISAVKEGLNQKTVLLIDLQDIAQIISYKKDLTTYLSMSIKEVKLTKNPKPTISILDLPNIDFEKLASS